MKRAFPGLSDLQGNQIIIKLIILITPFKIKTISYRRFSEVIYNWTSPSSYMNLDDEILNATCNEVDRRTELYIVYWYCKVISCTHSFIVASSSEQPKMKLVSYCKKSELKN